MPALASVLRAVGQALQSFVSGLRWLARQAYRQRTLGVASNPQLARLLDVHFTTVSAHLALLAALMVAGPTARDWLLSLPILILFTAVGIWRPTRLVIGLLLGTELLLSVFAAILAPGGILLAMLFALAMAQQAAVIRGARGKLGRATAAGLLLGVFSGGAGLILGLLAPAAPLWIFAPLMAVAFVLSLRMPPSPPSSPPRPSLPEQTRQAAQHPTLPDGYSIYRPSSLDDPPR